MNPVSNLVLAAVIALGLSACGGLKYMHHATEAPALSAGSGEATVVFIRHSRYAGKKKFVIMDHTGRFLGEMLGRSYFVSTMPAGEYTFVSWSEGTPALRATLEAGRTYYVEVRMSVGAWSPRARLFAVGPERELWPEVSEWLAMSKPLVQNPGMEEFFANERGDEPARVVRKGLANYADYDAEAKAERTLTPADGVAQ